METSLTEVVTLALTERCNLDCLYCYEQHKSSAEMEITQVRSIIDYEFSTCTHGRIVFELFGGEPFLRFDLIKENA